jgi:hypothetical protein
MLTFDQRDFHAKLRRANSCYIATWPSTNDDEISHFYL